MPVQVWIGEKPEHPQERRAIVSLAQSLERLEGLHLILANFSVGGRAVDMVIIKHDAIVIIELKHVDGRVFGSVNGPWTVVGSNGEEKRLNPGRKNPYNQVISYFHALTNYLNEHRHTFLSEQKAGALDFRTCKRVVVIAPTIQAGSQIELDWKVELRGLDELATYLITERSSEIELTDSEMLAIPRMLGCEPWQELAAVIAAPPPSAPVVAVGPVQPAAAAGGRPLLRGTVDTRALRFLALLGTIAAVLLSIWLLLPGRMISLDQPLVQLPVPTGTTALGITTETPPCSWQENQLVARRWDEQTRQWASVAVGQSTSGVGADVVLALVGINACDEQLVISWNVQNNSTRDLTLSITSATLEVSDGFGNRYVFADADLPGAVTVTPGGQSALRGAAARGLAVNAGTLLIVLRDQPFGEASFLIALEQ